MFTSSLLFLQEAATKIIFMEIKSCYGSHRTVRIFSFILSRLRASL